MASYWPRRSRSRSCAEYTSADTDTTASAAHRFIASQSGLGDEAARTMEQLRATAEAVQRLADFLERNPQALITGKKR